MTETIFANREDAGWRLAERLRDLRLVRPLVLAIPRGGVEVAAPVARVLDAELDVVLARKLRAPLQPELALGAVSEHGVVHLNAHAAALSDFGAAAIDAERDRQLLSIRKMAERYRVAKSAADPAGRSVVLVDDGVATGATMIASALAVRARGPHEIIIAIPVAPPERLAELRRVSDTVVCLAAPSDFFAVGQFYRDFGQVSDERVVQLLRDPASSSGDRPGGDDLLESPGPPRLVRVPVATNRPAREGVIREG